MVRDGNNDAVMQLQFDSWYMVEDHAIPDLPNTNNKEETLCVVMKDQARGVKIQLFYSTFKDSDVIVKSTAITNQSQEVLYVERAMSSQIDIQDEGWLLDTLDGAWARERYINTRPVQDGVTVASYEGSYDNVVGLPTEKLRSLINGLITEN